MLIRVNMLSRMCVGDLDFKKGWSPVPALDRVNKSLLIIFIFIIIYIKFTNTSETIGSVIIQL